MNELLKIGPLVLLAQAGEFFADNNLPPPNRSTLRRWAEDGVTVGGRRVRLAAVRRGCRWFTTRAAVEEFLAAVNAAQPMAV